MKNRIAAIVQLEPGELPGLVWSFVYFFCLLCGYYILRPVRDEMAIQGGVQHLPWLMTSTFLTLLAATPVFGWLSARIPRVRLLLTIYLFFGVNLAVFYVLLAGHIAPAWVARSFFVWLSVFNLFVVTVFWSFMADLFTSRQGTRLFGIISAGGSLGALSGPAFAAMLTYVVTIAHFMLISAVLLMCCLGCIVQLDRWSRRTVPSPTFPALSAPPHEQSDGLGGSMWDGIRLTMGSPYLLGISLYLLCLTTTATFLYLEQTKLVSLGFANPAERTRLFAQIDLVVNAFTFLVQCFGTGRLLERRGLATALLFLPIASAMGFGGLGLAQTLPLFILFSVLRRVGEYGIAKPAREVLFTVVSRREKYKAKNFIDTALSRGGDASSGWLFSGLKTLGATTDLLAWALVPLTFFWAGLGLWLARHHARMARRG